MKPLIIYTGYAIRYPLGGHLLAELHHLVGLHRLGFDLLYVEESGGPGATCYDPVHNDMTADPAYGIATLQHALRPFGLDHNWCYVDAQGRYQGRSRAELRAACRQAALLYAHSRVTWLEEFRECRAAAFIDTDPAITQFEMANAPRASTSGYASPFDFQFHFTMGENIGRPGNTVPTGGLQWGPARFPLALELVPVQPAPAAAPFTTVMSWRARGPVHYGGVTYGDKDQEFSRFLQLPRKVGPIFEIALAGGAAARAKLEQAGWRVSDARAATLTVAAYRQFIGRSRGEFSIVKNVYVDTHAGSISDRSASYLAAGKPVIVQETGFSEFIPCGEGLFAFRDEADVVRAVAEIQRDYPRHCRAARAVAEEHFNARKLLGALLERCGVSVPG